MARQKNQELRQKILKVSYKRFMQDDYNNIYLKDIAAECGISASLLHHYFPTKADIIINIIYDMIAKIQLFLEHTPECVSLVKKNSMANNELLNRIFVHMLARNNGQILRFYSYVLCDARLMNQIVDFCFNQFSELPELKNTFEKRYEWYIYYGSLAQVALLYLDNRLITSLEDAATALHDRWYFALGIATEEWHEIREGVDEILNQEFLDEFYREYIISLDDFVFCDW